MTDWIYEPTPPMGGATGGAYANTISGTGMELGAVLARLSKTAWMPPTAMTPAFACASKHASSVEQRRGSS